MQSTKKIMTCVVSTALALSVSAIYAQEPLTLTSCLDLAMKNNPSMQIAQANREKSEWNFQESRAYNGVKLGYNYSYGRSDQPPSWYNNTTAAYPSTSFSYPAWTKTYTFYAHQLALQVPLYTGRKLESTADMTRHGKEIADLGLVTAKQQLQLDVTTAYYLSLETQNLAKVANQSVDDFNEHLTHVQAMYDEGAVALADVLQTEVRLANAKNNLIKAQNAAKMARFKLNTTIGIALTDDVALAENPNMPSLQPDLDSCLKTALANRPELKQAALKVAVAGDKIKIARSESLPTVSAAAIENIKDTVPSGSKHDTDWTVLVNVSFNVFDNGIAETKSKAAKAEQTIAEQQKRQAEDAITLEVSHAYLSVQEAAERIKNNEVAVHKSERDYQMAQERYEAGVGTNLDVIDAAVAMTQANNNYVQAVYDYNISRAQLSKAMAL